MTEKLSVNIEDSWKEVLAPTFEQEYFGQLRETIRSAYTQKTIYPAPQHLFNAFTLCPFSKVAVVILGQDPYHGIGQAHGLSFSVPEGITPPPSLQNIFKEIRDDIGQTIIQNGDLTPWAKQGVLLLNSILTVEKNKPASHHGIGWETFTDTVIETISKEKEHIVFMLWGNYAKEKAKGIDTQKHLILTAAHPSPFSAHNGFFGCNHFSKANTYLKERNKKEIQW